MKKINIILFSLCLSASAVFTTNCFAQTDSFTFIKKITGNYSYINVDNLDNVYLINETNQLKKIDAKGDSVAVFNDVKRFGNPSYMDVANPLKVLLYYNTYNTTVVLDRYLSIRNTLNFRKQNIFSVAAIATSYDNNLWLFDDGNYKIKKIDDDGKQLQESVDWRNLFDTLPTPSQLLDRNNFLYLYDTAKGFYVFDYYGAFKNKLPFLHWSNVEISGDYLYGFKENKLLSYNLQKLTLKEYLLPTFLGDYSAIKATNGKLYLLKSDGVYIYQLQ